MTGPHRYCTVPVRHPYCPVPVLFCARISYPHALVPTTINCSPRKMTPYGPDWAPHTVAKRPEVRDFSVADDGPTIRKSKASH